MVKYGFFTSQNGDRKYTAEDISTYFKGLVSNGVFANVSNGLQVFADSNMRVSVSSGKGFIDGYWMENTSPYAVTIQASEIALPRIDAIMMMYSSVVREVYIGYVRGTPSANPTVPAVTRNDTLKTYTLASIYVAPGTTAITQGNITDMRASADCGWVTGLITQVDTATLFTQWETAYNTFYDTSTKAFDEWYRYLTEVVQKSIAIKQFSSNYAAGESIKTIPVNIPEFDMQIDVFNAYINGLKLIPEVDYKMESSEEIILTKAVNKGTVVHMDVIKSVQASEAEKLTDLVYDLRRRVAELEAKK